MLSLCNAGVLASGDEAIMMEGDGDLVGGCGDLAPPDLLKRASRWSRFSVPSLVPFAFCSVAGFVVLSVSELSGRLSSCGWNGCFGPSSDAAALFSDPGLVRMVKGAVGVREPVVVGVLVFGCLAGRAGDCEECVRADFFVAVETGTGAGPGANTGAGAGAGL